MNNKNSKTNNSEPIFPENSVLIIEKILETYGLITKEEEGIEKFINSKNPQEKKEIFENLPGSKISKTVRSYGENKISLDDLPLSLEKELNISKKEAKEIAKELEETLLVFIKQASVEEISTKESIEETFVKEVEAKPETISKSEKREEEFQGVLKETERTIQEKPKIPSSKDVYREPIE